MSFLSNLFSGFQGIMNPNVSASIANNGTTSGAIRLNGFSLCGIMMPAAFTGTALTFTACSTELGTYLPVYNSAGALSYTVAQGRYVAIDPKDFQGITFLKIVSGSAEAGARTLICSLKGI